MITITIKTDNAAFQDGMHSAEVAGILRRLADQVDRRMDLFVRDTNGNKVGAVTLTGEDRKRFCDWRRS